MLIARIYEVFPLVCPQCGGELKIVTFITGADPFQRVLIHIGEPVTPPQFALARGLPEWSEADFDQTYPHDSEQAKPVLEFDQAVNR
jgi:hypothetical protein